MQTVKDKKRDVVFLGGENFDPVAVTKQQWCNLHYYFIDISSANRENLVSVINEPVERVRFLEALHHNGPFQPLGRPSAFGKAHGRIESILAGEALRRESHFAYAWSGWLLFFSAGGTVAMRGE